MANKPEEEKQLRLKRMGEGVSQSYWDKPEEKRYEPVQKRKNKFNAIYGVPYNPNSLNKLHEANRNKTEEEKEQIKISRKLLSRTEEEKLQSNLKRQQHYIDDPEKRGKQVIKANETKESKSDEEKQEIINRIRFTTMNKTDLEKAEIRNSKIQTFIKNDSFPHKAGTPAKKSIRLIF